MILLLASLAGSYLNIPVAQLPEQRVISGQLISFFGMDYVVPTVTDWPGTVIAINVGGALIPGLLSLYLLVKYRLWLLGGVAIATVALVLSRRNAPALASHHRLPPSRRDFRKSSNYTTVLQEFFNTIGHMQPLANGAQLRRSEAVLSELDTSQGRRPSCRNRNGRFAASTWKAATAIISALASIPTRRRRRRTTTAPQ
jgi:hypothetical protein